MIVSPLRFVSATVKDRLPLFVLYFRCIMFDACCRCHFFKRDLLNLHEMMDPCLVFRTILSRMFAKLPSLSVCSMFLSSEFSADCEWGWISFDVNCTNLYHKRASKTYPRWRMVCFIVIKQVFGDLGNCEFLFFFRMVEWRGKYAGFYSVMRVLFLRQAITDKGPRPITETVQD